MYCYREFIVGIVVSAIAVFRLVDRVNSNHDTGSHYQRPSSAISLECLRHTDRPTTSVSCMFMGCILYNTLFSREEIFAKNEFEIFSREDIFANILFTRKYLPAKISSRENIFPRKYLPAKIIFPRNDIPANCFRAANM